MRIETKYNVIIALKLIENNVIISLKFIRYYVFITKIKRTKYDMKCLGYKSSFQNFPHFVIINMSNIHSS